MESYDPLQIQNKHVRDEFNSRIKEMVPWHNSCKDELKTHTHTEVLRNPELNLYMDR